jgi:GT2 family glycosyltransferase
LTLTSLVILTYNCLRYTQACLLSIARHTPEHHEVVVVDNASSDGTPEYLRQLPEHRLILNTDNRGYAAGNNQGLALSRGDYLLLLNNDVIVTPGWLAGMLAHFERHPRLGILGPRTNCISGPQKIPLDYHPWDIDAMEAVALQRRVRFEGQLSLTQRVAGFAMMFRRELYDQIGGLDERFGTGNFEDDDYCQRALEAGYEIGIAEDVFIHHFGSVSFLENKIDHKALMETNRQLFLSKWGQKPAYLPAWPEVQRLIPNGFFRVLDLGCQAGRFGAALRQRHPDFYVLGIEPDPLLAAEARLVLNRVIESRLEDDWSLDAETELFDVVVFNGSLEFCRNPGQMLKKVQSSLKSDGIMVVNISNMLHWKVLQKWLSGRWQYTDFQVPQKIQQRFFTAQDLVIMFEACGLSIERWYAVPGGALPEGLNLEKAEHMLQALGIDNQLNQEATVARWIVLGGAVAHAPARLARYGLKHPVLYWKHPRCDHPQWNTSRLSSASELSPASNVTIHCEPPEHLSVDSGTLLHIARLSEPLSLTLEAMERLQSMDQIWVDSEVLRQTLINKGFAAEQLWVLPPLTPDTPPQELERLADQLQSLSEKLKLLRS